MGTLVMGIVLMFTGICEYSNLRRSISDNSLPEAPEKYLLFFPVCSMITTKTYRCLVG